MSGGSTVHHETPAASRDDARPGVPRRMCRRHGLRLPALPGPLPQYPRSTHPAIPSPVTRWADPRSRSDGHPRRSGSHTRQVPDCGGGLPTPPAGRCLGGRGQVVRDRAGSWSSPLPPRGRSGMSRRGTRSVASSGIDRGGWILGASRGFPRRPGAAGRGLGALAAVSAPVGT